MVIYLLVCRERDVLYMKSIMTRSSIDVHSYDNGFLLEFGDWSDYMIAKIMMNDKKIFFHELFGSFM